MSSVGSSSASTLSSSSSSASSSSLSSASSSASSSSYRNESCMIHLRKSQEALYGVDVPDPLTRANLESKCSYIHGLQVKLKASFYRTSR